MSEIPEGYSRVTQVLQWYAGKMKAPEDVVARKGLIGSAVHQAIQADHEGGFFPLNEEEQGYFASYLQWKSVAKPRIVQFEKRYNCSTLKLSGQVDAIISFPHFQGLHVIDFKTSAQENAKLWKLQGAFYQYLAAVNGQELLPSVFFIKLDKHGKLPKVIEYVIDIGAKKMAMDMMKIYNHFLDIA